MSKNYSTMATEILENLGGASNVRFFAHCVTRLRVTVKDKGQVNEDALRKIEGVMGTVWSNGQIQVIIGGAVAEVYDAVAAAGNLKKEDVIDENLDEVSEASPKSAKDILGLVMETIASILAPVIPAIVACGLLQGIMYSLVTLGKLDLGDPTASFFFTCSQTAFYFLPILTAFSAGKRFGCNPFLAATTAAIIMNPNLAANAGTTIKLFGLIPLTYAGYSSTVIPAILVVWFESYIEKACKKVVPKMIDIIVTPLVSVVVSAVVGWVLLAPLGNWIGTFVATGILWLYTTLGPVGGAICAALYPFQLMTGMQVAMSPITVQNLATLGYDFIYPCTACSNAAMATCALYVYFKSKKANNKSLGLSTGITGMIGVTEPVMFGLILKYKKLLYATMIGGGIGGIVMGMFTVQYLSFGFVPFGTIVLAMTETFPYYMIGVCLSIVATVVTLVVMKFED